MSIQEAVAVNIQTSGPVPLAIPVVDASSIPKTNIVFSFDTTGSMSGALGSIRREIKNIINTMFDKVPGISIGIIAHGDYGDEERGTYLIKSIDITEDRQKLINFVENTGGSGGNWYAAYDKVLKDVQMFSWTSEISRSLVMIGDSIPREKGNITNIDWRHETAELASLGINVYSIQCLDSGDALARTFYKYMSAKTNGYHLYLDQFSNLKDILVAICYKQLGDDNLERNEGDFQSAGSALKGLSKNMRSVIDILLKKTTTEIVEDENQRTYDYSSFNGRSASTTASSTSTSTVRRKKAVPDYSNLRPEDIILKPSAPSRFQIIDVTNDVSIKDFAALNTLTFKAGCGFYEFTKAEAISKTKEIVLLDKRDGLIYEGLGCRQMLNLFNYDPDKKIKPSAWPDYTVFVQSTSYTRKLLSGTKFIYDISQ